MRTRDALKCRERLAIENYIRKNKKAGANLEFDGEDVIAFSAAYRLNRRGVSKSLQNMTYQNAGIRKAGPGTYVAYADNHTSWANDAEAALATASTSTIKLKGSRRGTRRKPRRIAAQAASLAKKNTKAAAAQKTAEKDAVEERRYHLVSAITHLIVADEMVLAKQALRAFRATE